ncbi:hypothetical protein [Paenimyroides ceti]
MALTDDEIKRIGKVAAAESMKMLKDFLKPQSEGEIKTNKAYTITQVAEIFGKDTSTIRRWYNHGKFKKNRAGLFTGDSVKREYDKLNAQR